MTQQKKLRDRWYYLIFLVSLTFSVPLTLSITIFLSSDLARETSPMSSNDMPFFALIFLIAIIVGAIPTLATAVYALLSQSFKPIKWMLSTILFGTIAAFCWGMIFGGAPFFAAIGLIVILLATSAIRLLECRMNRERKGI